MDTKRKLYIAGVMIDDAFYTLETLYSKKRSSNTNIYDKAYLYLCIVTALSLDRNVIFIYQ
ncbi:hypothetical protein NUITMVP1_24180 [Proteus mirabilis]|nr:hypothetical protein NUITMVP1_24180 [Proteus mirabilis]